MEQLTHSMPLVAVRAIAPFLLECAWRDGTHKIIDLEPELYNGLAPLKDNPDLFMQAHLAHGGWAVVWNDEMDFAAEGLYILDEVLV